MLKQALTDDEVGSATRLAKFVGLYVYMAAGGGVCRDLFGEPDECWLQDVPLLHRLAQDRLKAVASVER
jgi:ParB family chromosome partitioning protein